MTGDTLNYKKHLATIFSQYWQKHEEETPSNSTRPHTRGAICMVPRGNKQGGLKCMKLGNMKNMVRRSWYTTPMPNIVIARVNELDQGQPNDLYFLDYQEASNRRYQWHMSGFWGNWIPTYWDVRTRYWYQLYIGHWIPTHWADKTRDWSRSYIGHHRNTTRTSGTLRHANYWSIKRYSFWKIRYIPSHRRTKNRSNCATIEGRRNTGDHFSGQYFYPWGNTRSA